jgi:NUMOD1 domain
MREPTSRNSEMVFRNVRELAKYLNISERRLRQYKASGRLNYTADATRSSQK